MRIERVNGDYVAIGKHLGLVQREGGRHFPRVSETKCEFASQCAKAVEEYAPDLLDEIGAASDVGGWDLTAVLAGALAYDFHSQCTVLAVSGEETADGRPIFGRNHDWMMSILSYSVVLDSNPTKSLRSLQFIETPGLSAGGINEAGLAVGVTLVARNTIRPRPGIAANVAARWILDHFTTAEEAVDYLRAIPHISGYTILVADAQGAMARAEVSPERVVIGEPEDGLILATTHYLRDKMHEFEDLSIDFEWTYERERRVRNWFARNRGKIGPKEVQHVLGTHQEGVCCHWLEEGEDAGTTWSWTSSLGTGKMHASLGPPCEVGYQELGLD
jgi:predicted choloylglycine hydrolase